MKIEVLVIDTNAILVKGLRTAAESRQIADSVESTARAEIMKDLTEEQFVAHTFEYITHRINRECEAGKRTVCVTGYGDRSSPLRSYGDFRCDVMEEVLKTQVLPVLRQRGYYCTVSRHPFASTEKYFEINISW